jgi:hypothetical protein
MALFDINQVRLIQNGEPHDETTYNRPILDVGQQVGQIIEDFQTLVDGAVFTEINKPVILTPTEGQAGFTANVESSAFVTSDVFYGTHQISEWQLSTSAEFTTLADSYIGSSNLVSWAFSGILPVTTYCVRVRYGSDNHFSLWSDHVSFTTSDTYIETPTLNVTGTPDSVPQTPTLTASAFTVANGTDVHASTDWKVYQGGSLIWSSLGNTVNLTSIVVPDGVLAVNTTYSFRVVYSGTTYGSSGEASVSGKTLSSFIAAPTLSATSSSYNEEDTVAFTITNYNAALSYVITVDGGTYTRSGSNISWTLPSVSSDTVYGFYIYATDGTYNSATTTKSVLVLNIPIVGDSALQITDYAATEEQNSGYIYV